MIRTHDGNWWLIARLFRSAPTRGIGSGCPSVPTACEITRSGGSRSPRREPSDQRPLHNSGTNGRAMAAVRSAGSSRASLAWQPEIGTRCSGRLRSDGCTVTEALTCTTRCQ
jgi:hypothetical protein